MRRRNLPMGAVHTASRRKRPRVAWWRLPLFLLLLFIAAVAATWHFTRHDALTESPDGTGGADQTPDAATLPTERKPLVVFDAPSVVPIDEPKPAEPGPAKPSSDSPKTAIAPEEKNFRPRPPRDVFEAQIALTRDGICPGSIDGAWGGQTRAAVIAFQQKHGLRVTAQLDNTTRDGLIMTASPLTTYTVTSNDFLRLRPLPRGWLERSTLDRLDYSTILELVAEKHWTHPNQIKRLNPEVDWEKVTTGTVVIVPRVFREPPQMRPVLIVIHLAEKTLELFDADSRLLAHFPCSIARRVEKRPVGALQVEVLARDPNYTFNPETFPDSAEAQSIGRKLILQPGPNNPVGVAWIGLNLPGYGIHGSPDPEKIGRTESSGCFRLANWNARYLIDLAYIGMRVQVEP